MTRISRIPSGDAHASPLLFLISHMAYKKTSRRIELTFHEVLAALEPWFDMPAPLCGFRPASGGWSIDQVLEHITLTNHFLLLIIRKGRDKCLRRAARQGLPTGGESDLEPLQIIGRRGSFHWPRPEHMEPTNTSAGPEVRLLLRKQWEECLDILTQLADGAGSLYTVRMSVHGLGKLDMYQYLFFVAQHARRHLAQLEAIRAEYLQQLARDA